MERANAKEHPNRLRCVEVLPRDDCLWGGRHAGLAGSPAGSGLEWQWQTGDASLTNCLTASCYLLALYRCFFFLCDGCVFDKGMAGDGEEREKETRALPNKEATR